MKLRFLVVAVCALLALAPTALGAGSAGQGYGGKGGVQNEVSQGAVNSAGSGGSLPFTGTDLALLVAGGVSLLVVGAGLRRAAKRPS
jgi:hypothetical protein